MADVFLGKYEALRPLGKGSMGMVYLAKPQERPEERVVIKLMNERVAKEARFRQLFEREIELTARLRHPYAVRLLDSSFDDPHGPCLVMEYIPGVTLDTLLRTEIRFSPERAARLLGMLCHALEAAHRVGIVHRDLKPSNLMITDAGTPKELLRVMDFGLAQLTLKPHFSLERLAGAKITSAMGTPSYVPPEALRGDEVDTRADIYSVGVILYEMLSGQGPFPHEETQELLHAHVYEPPRRFATVGAGEVSPEVEQVVQHCLAKFPIERPQTAREVAERFGKALREDIWTATRPPEEPKPEPAPVKPSRKAAPPEEPKPEPNTIVHRLDAWMPERIAVVKLRGFLEDYGGRVIASEPGLLRLQIGTPHQGGLLEFLGLRPRKPDPIEVEFQMEKPNPNENRLHLTVVFRPISGPPPRSPIAWRRSCENLFNELRSYLIAEV